MIDLPPPSSAEKAFALHLYAVVGFVGRVVLLGAGLLAIRALFEATGR